MVVLHEKEEKVETINPYAGQFTMTFIREPYIWILKDNVTGEEYIIANKGGIIKRESKSK